MDYEKKYKEAKKWIESIYSELSHEQQMEAEAFFPELKESEDDIEYIRKDAFIEKAEEFIYSALNDGIMGTANIEDFMRLFKKYMKGG